jgi:hypothetical protein
MPPLVFSSRAHSLSLSPAPTDDDDDDHYRAPSFFLLQLRFSFCPYAYDARWLVSVGRSLSMLSPPHPFIMFIIVVIMFDDRNPLLLLFWLFIEYFQSNDNN